MDRVGQKKAGERMARCLLLGLDGRVALELRLGDKREEGQHELVLGRDGRVGEDHGLFGVDAAGEIVHDHVVYIVADMLGRVAVGDDLVVGNHDVRLDAEVLQAHALADRAEIVAEVQTSGRTVAREHGIAFGLAGLDVRLDLVGALKRRFVAAFVWHNGISSFKLVLRLDMHIQRNLRTDYNGSRRS